MKGPLKGNLFMDIKAIILSNDLSHRGHIQLDPEIYRLALLIPF